MNTLISEGPVTRTRPFIRKILVAVDLTKRSLGTARYAANIAKSFGASVIFVYVHPTETMFNFITAGGYDLIDSEQWNHRHSLVSLTEMVSKEYPFCTPTFLVGDPAKEVTKYAEEVEADLIVVASHHPSVLANLLHLDQAPKMVRRAARPVLVYQGDDCSSDGQGSRESGDT